jgi:hypothetical protein
MPNKGMSRTRHKLAWLFLLLVAGALPSVASAVPKVIVISLDGATPRLVDEQMQSGVLTRSAARAIAEQGHSRQSERDDLAPLTAPGHIAIAIARRPRTTTSSYWLHWSRARSPSTSAGSPPRSAAIRSTAPPRLTVTAEPLAPARRG